MGMTEETSRAPAGMQGKVVISTGHARLHLFYAAIVAQEAGLLSSLLTSFYLKERWASLVEGLARLSKRAFWNRLMLWRDYRLNEQVVVSLGSTELVSRLCMLSKVRVPKEGVRYLIEKIDSLYYGKMANRHIKHPVKLVHSRSGFSRAIIPHAHKIGAKVLLEQSIAHPSFTRDLLQEEYEKWKIPDSRRVYASPEKEMEWDIENSDFILTNSEFCADTIRRYLKSPKTIRVVPTGVDADHFRPTGAVRSREFRVLFAGSVDVRKGVVYVVEALKRLRLPRTKLLIVGSRSVDSPPIFSEKGVAIEYLQHVPYTGMPEVFGSADVFVFPSLVEGSARVVGEAMASGLCCIVTPNAGSVINDGVDGFIVPPRDVDSLAERIQQVYENPDLALEIGRSARKTVVERLTWKHYQENLIRVYTDLLQSV